MADISARPDIRDKTAKHKIWIWKSKAVANGDTMTLPGVKEVFTVEMRTNLVWTFTAPTLTFTTVTGTPVTGPLVITCR